ncbi:hypothetical protein GXW78_25495 [Roseomonas terrae]|jgi:hypothetical protein|uniref:Uncharacterized protein n=1 Tax=Neoroseomonas terrae TaxID=424799 RepID=A0ABS5EPS3_9PROT|nr:hypothetical protein [Neoroseomonas terrae]
MKNQVTHIALPGHKPLPLAGIPGKTAVDAPEPAGLSNAELRRLVLDLMG